MTLAERLQDTKGREMLAEQVLALIRVDARVAAVTIGGSLRAEDGADPYSDIDIGVQLKPGVPDRQFAEDVPALVAPIGPLLADGWGVRVLPGKYVRTIYFADYPLFWHVDISSHSDTHIDGTDLLSAYHWPRLFKTWQETVKWVLRGKDQGQPDFVETMLGRWIDLPPIDLSMPSALRLASYLDLCAERTRAERSELAQKSLGIVLPDEALIEQFYQRCDALRQEYLAPKHSRH